MPGLTRLAKSLLLLRSLGKVILGGRYRDGAQGCSGGPCVGERPALGALASAAWLPARSRLVEEGDEAAALGLGDTLRPLWRVIHRVGLAVHAGRVLWWYRHSLSC